MPKKTSNPKKSAQEKTIISKIARQVGHMAGGLVAGKDHLVEMAGDAIESVKSRIQNFNTKEKTTPKKAVKAKPTKAGKKQASESTKKSSNPAAVKKSASPKKAIKKVAKKVAAKK